MKTKREKFSNGLEWPIVLFIGSIHILAIALSICFPTWEGLIVFIVLYLLSGWGVTIGYHRKLTHSSFRSPKYIDYIFAVLGLLAGEGPPIYWVAHHRKHHRFSDQSGDPHSPRDGFWWAHWLWLFPSHNKFKLGALYKRWAPDLAQNRFYQFLESSYLYWHLAMIVLLFLTGLWIGNWVTGLSLVAYGFFLRIVVVLHTTWMVNSLAHTWGYRNYKTKDDSQNNPFVGVAAHGEGWHNNHHYVQGAVNHGHRWWEIDLSFGLIFILALLSWPLAWIGLGKWRPVYHLKFYRFKKKNTKILFPA